MRKLAAESFGAFALVAVGGFAIVGLPQQLAPVGVPIGMTILLGAAAGALLHDLIIQRKKRHGMIRWPDSAR